jgi:hypothetical protein
MPDPQSSQTGHEPALGVTGDGTGEARPAEAKITLADWVQNHVIALLVLGALLIFIGAFISEAKDWYPNKSTIASFFKELGVAVIIAFSLAVTIEHWHRERAKKALNDQIETIKKDVFKAVYGTRIDPKLTDLINDNVLKSPFYRRFYEVRVQIDAENSSEPITDESVLKVYVEFCYEVENVTNNAKVYKFKGFIEKPHRTEHAEKVRMSYLKIDEQKLDEAEFEEHGGKIENSTDFRSYSKEVSIEAGGSVRFEARFRTYKFGRDSFVWRTREPCDGLHVIVSHPKELVVYGDAMHCVEEYEKRGGDEDDTMFFLRITRPLLSANGVQIWWFVKSAIHTSRIAPAADSNR